MAISTSITVSTVESDMRNCFFAPFHAGAHALQGTGGVHLQLACGVQYLPLRSNALGHVPVPPSQS
jgi:hypothetical protein